MLATISCATDASASVAFVGGGDDIQYVMNFDRIDRSSDGTYVYRAIERTSKDTSHLVTHTFPFRADISGDQIRLRFRTPGKSCAGFRGRFRRNFATVRFAVPSVYNGEALLVLDRVTRPQMREFDRIITDQAETAGGYAALPATHDRDAFFPGCSPIAKTHASK